MKKISNNQQLMNTSIKTGLTDSEVVKRRALYGLHLLKPIVDSWQTLLFRQLRSPFIHLLAIAASLSLVLGDVVNSLIIFLIIVVNTVFSFIQEYRASRAARLLASYIIPTAHVRRDSKEITIETSDLVIGDVVIINPGDTVPADMILVESDNLTIDESVLTGESIPIEKNTSTREATLIYMGTSVLTGIGTAIVSAIGADTQFGEITTLTLLAPHESSFQENLTALSTFLIKLTLVLLICVMIINLIVKGHHVDIMQLLLFCIALTITVTPEALPVVTTVALAEGAFALARQKVLVKRLSAIEDLGSITLLCTDKTGTLTENKLTVEDIYSFKSNDPLFFATISHPHAPSAFEVATLAKLSQEQKARSSQYSVIRETPFDPVHRRTSKLIKNKTFLLAVKGAFEEIYERCNNIDQNDLKILNEWVTQHETKGERVIAVAIKEDVSTETALSAQEGNLSLYGLIAFVDPIKRTVPDALHKAQAMGIKIKILTGDSVDVAAAVASTIGLISGKKDVISGKELDALAENEKNAAIDSYTVFARVTPLQKYTIVEHLKQHETVGFLGDGINDAPALRAAHVGIAVVEASDIARSAADILLLKKSLSVIIDGIASGRRVFANTVKYIRTTLSSNMGNFYSISLASFFLDYLPMLPLQLLLANLISDSPMIAIATDTIEPDELKHPSHYSIQDFALSSLVFGVVSSFFDFLVFALYARSPAAVLQTAWFITSTLTELVFIFSMRSKKLILFATRPSFSLLMLTLGAGLLCIYLPFSTFGQKAFSFIRPTGGMMLVVFFIVVGYLIINEMVKILYYRLRKESTNTTKNPTVRHKKNHA